MPVFTLPIHEHGEPGQPNYPHPIGKKTSGIDRDSEAAVIGRYTRSEDTASKIVEASKSYLAGTSVEVEAKRQKAMEVWHRDPNLVKNYTPERLAEFRQDAARDAARLAHDAKVLSDMVRSAPEQTTTLYRSIGFDGLSPEAHAPFDALKEGDELSLQQLSSFSADSQVAASFAFSRGSLQSGVHRDWVQAPSDVDEVLEKARNYHFVLEGPHKAAGIADRSAVKWEEEFLTHGRFRVIRVIGQTSTKGVTHHRTFVLQQIGVY